MAAFLTPGPSEPYPRLREFMDDAWRTDVMAISHRGKSFTDIYRQTDAAVREVMGVPADYSLMFLGSATEAMERIVQGVVEHRSHHFVNGAFSAKWMKIAKQLGKQVTVSRADAGKGFTRADYAIPSGTELICLTQNESSTGVVLPAAEFARVKGSGRPLIALDVVSSAPMVPIDFGRVDLAFFSVQKAFGLPAGLGVLVASPRAVKRASELESRGVGVGSYHSLPSLASEAAKFQTPATPNVLGIYLLGRVAEDLNARGISELREENRIRAERLYEALETSNDIQPFVADTMWRSPTVVTADVRGGSGGLHSSLSDRGIVVGRGYSEFKNNHLRIANFPATTPAVFDELVSHLVQFSGPRV